MMDYFIQQNGSLNYHDLCLSDSLNKHKVVYEEKGKETQTARFIPPFSIDITDQFIKRNKNFIWNEYSDVKIQNLCWQPVAGNWSTKYKNMTITVVPEFANQYGYASGCASQINIFQEKYDMTRR